MVALKAAAGLTPKIIVSPDADYRFARAALSKAGRPKSKFLSVSVDTRPGLNTAWSYDAAGRLETASQGRPLVSIS